MKDYGPSEAIRVPLRADLDTGTTTGTGTAGKAVPTFREGIERRAWDSLGRQAFVREYVRTLTPVVITGALNHWAALGKWTPEYLRDHFGDVEVTPKGQKWRLGDFANAVLASTPEKPAPYLHNHPLRLLPAAMRADLEPMPDCTHPNWLDSPLLPPGAHMTYPELYFGGAGAVFPVLHYDALHLHAILMQIHGDKEYIVFAPDQSDRMYSRGGVEENKSAIDDPEGADAARFPLYAKAQGVRFRLHPGEILFLPTGWWHTARILTPSITVSVNAANQPNWRDFSRDYVRAAYSTARLKGAIVYPYLALVGMLEGLM
jgi:hypothetical protein